MNATTKFFFKEMLALIEFIARECCSPDGRRVVSRECERIREELK